MTALEVLRLWNGQVGTAPDTRSQMDDILSRAVPDPRAGADARPAVKHAMAVFADLQREARSAVDANGVPLYLEFDTIGTVLEKDDPQRQARLREFAIRSLDALVERGVVTQLAGAFDRPHVFMETWNSERQAYLVEDFGNLRRIHRGLRYLTTRAVERGDWDQFVESLKARLVLTRFALGQPDMLGRLVGEDAFGKIADDIQDAFVTRPPPMGVAVRVLEVVRTTPWSDDLRLWIDLHGLTIRRTLDGFYTDDGHGNGYPVWSRFNDSPLFRTVLAFHPSWANFMFLAFGSIDGGPGDLVGLMMLDKRTALASIDGYLETIRVASSLSRPERQPPLQWRTIALWPPFAFHSRFMEVSAKPLVRWLEHEDVLRLRRSGLQLLLAIHVFHDERHRWPDSLNELPEDERALALRDPVSGLPLMYKRIDPSSDALGRAFVLYAVGADGVDEGGQEPAHPSMAFDSRPQGDFVFNGTPAKK